MTKLLFMDIDGTLMAGHKTISPRTLNCLRDLLDQDFRLYVATGRKFAAAAEVAAMIDPRVGVIASNGSVVSIDGGLTSQRLSAAAQESIYQIAKEHQVPLFFFGLEKTFYSGQLLPFFSKEDEARVAGGGESLFQQLNSLADLQSVSSEIINGIIIEENDLSKLPAVKQALQQVPDLSLSSSHENNIELIPTNVSKATAIAIVQRHYDVSYDDLFAFGDGHNDIEMLQAVSVGVAMGNAAPAVKAVAAYTTSTNTEDGIAVFMEKYLKGVLKHV